MYPELSTVGDDLREIQENLSFSLLEIKMVRVHSDTKKNLVISSVFCSSQCCGMWSRILAEKKLNGSRFLAMQWKSCHSAYKEPVIGPNDLAQAMTKHAHLEAGTPFTFGNVDPCASSSLLANSTSWKAFHFPRPFFLSIPIPWAATEHNLSSNSDVLFRVSLISYHLRA